jgi:hypothetical protein
VGAGPVRRVISFLVLVAASSCVGREANLRNAGPLLPPPALGRRDKELRSPQNSERSGRSGFPLSPSALGWGEGRVRGVRVSAEKRRRKLMRWPLTPTLSPTFVGERERKLVRYTQSSLSYLRRCQREIASVQALHRRSERVRRSGIVNHIIRQGQPLLARRLHRQNAQRRIAGDTVTLHDPGELRFKRHVDDQSAIDPGVVFMRFRQQRNDEHAVRIRASNCGSQQRFAHLRMKNTLQPSPLIDIGEHPFAHSASIEFTRSREHVGAECSGYFRKRRLARVHELTRDDICIEDRNAALAKCFGNGALAGCDSTGECDRKRSRAAAPIRAVHSRVLCPFA